MNSLISFVAKVRQESHWSEYIIHVMGGGGLLNTFLIAKYRPRSTNAVRNVDWYQSLNRVFFTVNKNLEDKTANNILM